MPKTKVLVRRRRGLLHVKNDAEMRILTVLGPYDMDAQQTFFAQEFQITISGVLLPWLENTRFFVDVGSAFMSVLASM